jgi:hypothetical protein
MRRQTNIKGQERPTVSLSSLGTANRASSYGTAQPTVTVNTGAILTSYMMSNISVKKLAEEVVSSAAEVSAKEKADKERSDILAETFEKFVKESEEESCFSFINETRRARGSSVNSTG